METPRSEHQLLAQLPQENINFKSIYTHKVKFIYYVCTNQWRTPCVD
jgi:hypothetical protein